MRKYFSYIITAIKCELFYKANIIGLALTSFVEIFLQVKLWDAIYRNVDLIDGVAYANVFYYLVVGIVVRRLIGAGIDDVISRDFVSGKIALDVLRPQKYILKCMCCDLGRGIIHVGMTLLVCLFVVILEGMSCEILTPTTFLMMIGSAILSYFLSIMLGFCIGASSIWTGRSVGFSMIKGSLFALLGGAYIPLDFYPFFAQRIINYLPFKYIYYAPISVLLNNDLLKWMNIFIHQAIWCMILAFLSYFIRIKSMSSLEIQGG